MDVSKEELVEFSNKFGPYPFADEKHGYYQFAWGGGMEHQTFSAMSAGSMASWSVIAHELAHQWFGDKVTFSTWNHLWLAEGFAKYGEVLAAELIPAIGVNPASHLSGIKSTARATNTTPVLLSAASISNSNTIWTTNNDNAVYQRGAMVVSMLRQMMGDTRFFQGCRDYLNDPLLAYKSAVTADLQRNMENQLSGVNLSPFFNAWINGTGTADYTGNYFISGKTIQINLNQTRNPATNPFMPMPVVIKIRNAGNTIDTTVVIYHAAQSDLRYAGLATGIAMTGNNFVSYNLSFVPAAVSFDPDNKTMATGSLTAIATPLEIKILNFTAVKQATDNQVNLSLATDESIEKIVLYKSADGTVFKEAGFMAKINTSGSVMNFRYHDLLPYLPLSFYQAKIFTAGKIEFSPVVKVQQLRQQDLVVAPNPANDIVQISFNNPGGKTKQIRIVNAAGKTMIETVTTNHLLHLDISYLPAGFYMVQAIESGKPAATGRFLVIH
jgi:hypothetical protein